MTTSSSRLSSEEEVRGSEVPVTTPPSRLFKRERERCLLRSWAKAEKDGEERRKATRSAGDDLEESAARALMRQ